MPFTYDYPRPMLTVDVVLIQGLSGTDPKVLLVRRKNDPYGGFWALPGGFMDMEETTIEAAQRELKEETGLECEALIPHGIRDQIDRDPRGRTITVIFSGLMDDVGSQPIAGDDAAETAWVPLRKLPELAFDHDEIIAEVMDDYSSFK